MKDLKEIVEENKKANEATKVEIKLDDRIVVTIGDTDGVLKITQGDKTIKLTTKVLGLMIQYNMIQYNIKECDFYTNDRILQFLLKELVG